MSIVVEPKYLSHEGGTKFYEVVMFHHVESNSFVQVNRWGPMKALAGGGESEVRVFNDARQCHDSALAKVKTKLRRGYFTSSCPHGFHGGVERIAEDMFPLSLSAHYRKQDLEDQVLDLLGLESPAFSGMNPEEVIEEGLDAGEPFQPDRSPDWGSW